MTKGEIKSTDYFNRCKIWNDKVTGEFSSNVKSIQILRLFNAKQKLTLKITYADATKLRKKNLLRKILEKDEKLEGL